MADPELIDPTPELIDPTMDVVSAPPLLEYENIGVDISGSVARITLNRPGTNNSLTIRMMQEITQAIEQLHGANQVRVVLLEATSASKAFSAGVALTDATPERAFQMVESFHGIFLAMLEISKPVVTVVNGPAVGAGCELALFGDLVLASEKAVFAQPEVKAGLFPPIAAVFLPHLVGPKRALQMILTGERIVAQEALRLGLVNRLVAEKELEKTVEALVTQISEQSAPVLEMAKKVIYLSMGLPLQDAMKKSADLYLNHLMELEDSQEGLRAILERRKPVWKNK
jgi:cyclohexa-1,5-dienecarbonyl-CoA hydratase